jgi:hypothetical protein
MLRHSRSTAALLTAVVALCGATGASASAAKHGSTGASHARAVKLAAVSKVRGAGSARPIDSSGRTVAAISAFPTGGKGSGSEATCALWSTRLQEDQQIVDNAPDPDKDDASGPLNSDVGNAMDAGCAVIF